jgi:DNA primase
MKQEDLLKVLETLRGVSLLKGSINDGHDNYFSVSCFFAQWSHPKKRDANPSMIISFADNEQSFVTCFACQYKGYLRNAIAKLNEITGYKTIGNLTTAVIEAELQIRPILSMDPVKTKTLKVHDYSNELAHFKQTACNHPDGAAFLHAKGCSDEIIRKMGLRWIDSIEVSKGPNDTYTIRRAILFPVFSKINGKIVCVGAQIRPLDRRPTQSKYINILEFPSHAYFYGDHLLDKMSGNDVFLVEGVMDCLHLIDIGVWSLGIFGLFLGETRATNLIKANPRRVFLMLDPDAEGQRAVGRILRDSRKYGLNLIPIIATKDPKQMTIEDINPLIS